MPNIIREDSTNLESTLTISLLKDELKEEVSKELKKIAKTKTFKGFRVGKTPVSFVKKMYGTSILNSVIQQQLESEVDKYMKTGELIASPIPAEDQNNYNITIGNIEDQYDFKFQIGLKPTVEVDLEAKLNGVVKQEMEEVPASEVEKQLNELLKSRAEFKPSDKPVIEKDQITLELKEKEGNGILSSTTIQLESHITPEFTAEIVGKEAGHTFDFDINKVLVESTTEKVNRQLFTEEKEDLTFTDAFEFKIISVETLVEPELNEEFVAGLGVEDLKSVDDLKKLITDNIKGAANNFLEGMAINQIFEKLFGSLDFDLPEDYLSKYTTLNNNNKPVDDLEPVFNSWRWQLFAADFAEKHNIQVTYDEVLNTEINRYMGMGFGNMPGAESYLKDMLVKQFEENPKFFSESYDKIFVSRLLKHVYDTVNLPKETISFEAFNELQDAEQKRQAEEQAARQGLTANAEEE